MYWLYFTRFCALACRIHTHSLKTNSISSVFCLETCTKVKGFSNAPRKAQACSLDRSTSVLAPAPDITLESCPLEFRAFSEIQRTCLAASDVFDFCFSRCLGNLSRTPVADSLRDDTSPQAHFGAEIRTPNPLARQTFIFERLGYDFFPNYRTFEFADKSLSLAYNANSCLNWRLASQGQTKIA